MTDLSNQLMRPVQNPATRFGNPAAQPSPMLGTRQMPNVIAPPAAAPPQFPQGNQLMRPMQQMNAPAPMVPPRNPEPERNAYHPEWEVSTAIRSKKAAGYDPHTRSGEIVSTEAMRGRGNPKAEAKFAEAMKRAQIDYDHIPNRTGDFAEDMTQHLHDNLVHLWQNIRDRPWLEHAANWYRTVHHLTGAEAVKNGVTHPQAAAVVAALSPKKDWDQNFNLAQRVLHIHAKHQDKVFSEPMRDFVKGTIEGRKDEAAKQIWRAELAKIPEGASLRSLQDPVHKAMFVRAFDEAGHEQHEGYDFKDRGFNVISPMGESIRAKRQDGGDKTITWQTYPAIANAMKALQSPDMANISRALGPGHKVRNFYNNIASPDSPNGHYTSDTHNIAAGHLMPLSVQHDYVKHGLGTGILGEKALTGTQGLYGIGADAGRRAAHTISRMEGRRFLPNEIQSPTWEAVRNMFEGKKDPTGHVAQTAEHVQRYARYGLIHPATARQWIINAAGGIPDPEWWTRRKRA